jgi:ubiquinone/menaquinone biosynthesis C-methylase UbiE
MAYNHEAINRQYDFIFDKMAGELWFVFMNHGFSPDYPFPKFPVLQPEDDRWRHQIYLYFYLLHTGLDILHADSSCRYDVLDIGCGRGGGLSAIKRYYGARRAVGVDLNARQILFCKERHKDLGLEFYQGDALALPFSENSFDLILNVESSHLYPDIAQFLREVHRVLRPGGLLLLADLREQKQVSSFSQGIENSMLQTLAKYDITGQVHKACTLDEERFSHLFPSDKRELPRSIATAAKRAYSRDGRTAYVVYVLRNNEVRH